MSSGQIYNQLSNLLERKVYGKAAKRGRKESKRAIKNVVGKTPEVMIKVTSKSTGLASMLSRLDYISRESEIEVTDQDGIVFKSKHENKKRMKAWSLDSGKRRKNTIDAINVMFSMPKGTNNKKLKKAVSEFAKQKFKNHEYIMAFHNDTNNPHVHLIIKNLGYNNKRLHMPKGEMQKWRATFAKKLNQQGIEANATPRSFRGIVKKDTKRPVYHIKKRKEKSLAEEARVEEIYNEYINKNTKKHKPWENKIKTEQNKVRLLWLNLAKNLKQEGKKTESKNVLSFLKSMPSINTERHDLIKTIKQLEVNKINTNDELAR